jgi:hypothetical protein
MLHAIRGSGMQIIDYVLPQRKVAFNFVNDGINVFPLKDVNDSTLKSRLCVHLHLRKILRLTIHNFATMLVMAMRDER